MYNTLIKELKDLLVKRREEIVIREEEIQELKSKLLTVRYAARGIEQRIKMLEGDRNEH
jgi:hypothetical protein